jgi:tRNA-specific 2-thiouridylase
MCKTVAVAMSGGVDSSTAAFLLKKQGYRVIGVHLLLGSNKPNSDIKAVAKRLNISLHIIDLRKKFQKIIIQQFITDYKNGLTPNPCVRCNKFIKFDLLIKEAKKLNADFLATGHYINLKDNKIYKAKDEKKDQTYFLCQINKKSIPYLLFPLAEYSKDEVKKIALKNKYYKKKIIESQDVCFIPRKDLYSFLKKYITNKPGDIIDANNNKVLGKHAGIAYYTIGQRSSVGGKGPYYVVKKDIKKNILYVTNNANSKQLYNKGLVMKSVNWFSLQKPKFPIKCTAKCRYKQEEIKVKVYKNKVFFNKPQRAITPGQYIVFYKGGQMLGGGIIIKGL